MDNAGATPQAARVASRRVRALDLLRLLAALQMVQGHTIDAVLSASYRSGGVHQAWIWCRGLTSVAFLFAAGASFHLATLRDFARHREDRGAVAGRFRRAITLVLIGYALHFPFWLPLLGSAPASAALRQAVLVDVLQCIGASLFVLEGLVVVLPSARAVEAAGAVLALALFALSPLAARVEASGPWLPLLDYVTRRGGSLFPLLPWAAHIMFGVACGGLLLSSPRPGLRLSAAAALLFAAGRLLPAAAAPLPDHLQRLGCVLLVLALLSQFEAASRALPRWVFRLSGETLFIYVFHVVLAYGDGLGLAAAVGRRLAPGPAVLVAAAMIALAFGGALVYRRAAGGLARSTKAG